MCKPLAVTGTGVWPGIASKNVGIFRIEAGIPNSLALHSLALQVIYVLRIPAEAGWTHQSAVGAAHAAFTDLRPVVGFQIIQQQFRQPLWIWHAAAHTVAGFIQLLLGARQPKGRSWLPLQVGRHHSTGFRADLNQEYVFQFRKAQVKTRFNAWSGAHGSAKTGVAGFQAFHSEDKCAFTPAAINGIVPIIPQEDAILNLDRSQLARPHSNQRQAGRMIAGKLGFPQAVFFAEFEESAAGREKELLPGVGTGRCVKEIIVAS